MPVKLIGVLAVAVFTACFTGFNLGHNCDVWFFHTFEKIPVAITIIISFVAGVIITLPFTFGKQVYKPTPKDIALEEKYKRREEKIKQKEAKKAAAEAKTAAAKAAKAEKKLISKDSSEKSVQITDEVSGEV